MRFFRVRAALAALLFPAGAALAEPATPEGAKQIEQDYAVYFTQAAIDKGIVTVAPDGEGYLVTWDLQKLADLSGFEGSIKIDALSYRLIPGTADVWTLRGDRLPRVSFEGSTDAGHTAGALEFHGAGVEGSYDPNADAFLRSKLEIEAAEGAFKTVEGDRVSDVKTDQRGILIETRAKAAENGNGVDLAIAEAFKSLSESASGPPPDGQGEPTLLNYGISGTVGEATVSGLRAREIGEVWKVAIANVDADEPPPEFAARMKAAFPLWDRLRAHAEIDEVNLEAPQGAAEMKALRETLDLSGLTNKGAAEIGLDIEGITLKSDQLPAWGREFWPASLSLDLMATGEGWDEAAKIALDDPSFLADGDLSAGAQDRIARSLASGHPKLVLKPGHLKLPPIDLTFEGEAQLEPEQPTGHLKVSADSLDKTIALLKEISRSEPDIAPLILGVTLLKGLAKIGADGRLVWEIVASADGGITVNGAPMPRGP